MGRCARCTGCKYVLYLHSGQCYLPWCSRLIKFSSENGIAYADTLESICKPWFKSSMRDVSKTIGFFMNRKVGEYMGMWDITASSNLKLSHPVFVIWKLLTAKEPDGSLLYSMCKFYMFCIV